jgi:hypothetical protein
MDGSLFGVFVLPDSDHTPSFGFQSLVGVEVTSTVGFDLFAPEIGVGFGPRAMNGTTVPKATIDEDGNVCFREGKIRPPSRSVQDWKIDSISESSSMQEMANPHLGSSVPLASI